MSHDGETADTAERELDLLAARAGMEIPDEWRAGTLAVYCELRKLAELVHSAKRSPDSEPAAIFSLTALLPEQGGDNPRP